MKVKIVSGAVITFVFLTVALFAQPVRPDFNRKQTYDVKHYKIQTSFNRANRQVIGETTITLKPLSADFRSVELDAVALTFKKVSLEPSGTELKQVRRNS